MVTRGYEVCLTECCVCEENRHGERSPAHGRRVRGTVHVAHIVRAVLAIRVVTVTVVSVLKQ